MKSTTSSYEHSKYKPFSQIQMSDRQWPNQTITSAPHWCSVDLRDGNQALIEPMTPEQKLKLFNLLLKIGFKEIEVGFPAASETDFDFVRKLIDEGLIPDDVTIQVLTPAREEMINKSFESLIGAKRAIVHLYNSTSSVQREQVFGMERSGITSLAVEGAKCILSLAQAQPSTQWTFEYSPESFTGTELDYAVEICDAVMDIWQPTPANKAIINLPATVEMSTPNIYADQIEWFCKNIARRDSLLISLHTHNDRGCAVAAAELGIMAGADRVEGTLMGNGERTGNMDVITMAMNIYSQGVDPELDFSAMDEIIRTVQDCTRLPVHERHPYAGELVFTAFSGSHQDAINKCLSYRSSNEHWEVAYLPIDPADLGRSYQEVIRINSQSGKGGIAYILEREYGLQLPRWLQIEFSAVVQKEAENTEGEITGDSIWRLFQEQYLQGQPDDAQEPQSKNSDSYLLSQYSVSRADNIDSINATLEHGGKATQIKGNGNGVIDAFINALNESFGKTIVLVDYAEHALKSPGDDGAKSEAMAYVQLNIGGERICGVAKSHDIIEASLSAITNGVNRSAQIGSRKAA